MLTWTTSTASTTKQQFEGGENFDYNVDRKTGWRYYRKPRGNRRQHLQLRSGRIRNGKQVGAHGSQHHLGGGDFGFLVYSTPTNTARTAQYSLFTSVERITRTWLKNRITSLCARKESVIWSAHVSPFVALSPAVHREHITFLFHSSLLPRHQDTHWNWDNTIHSKNTQCIINLSKNDQSKSIAFKSHSGVEISRVAETRATHPPQVMSPRSLRRSQGSQGLQIPINFSMHRKNLENKIATLRSPKK